MCAGTTISSTCLDCVPIFLTIRTCVTSFYPCHPVASKHWTRFWFKNSCLMAETPLGWLNERSSLMLHHYISQAFVGQNVQCCHIIMKETRVHERKRHAYKELHPFLVNIKKQLHPIGYFSLKLFHIFQFQIMFQIINYFSEVIPKLLSTFNIILRTVW